MGTMLQHNVGFITRAGGTFKRDRRLITFTFLDISQRLTHRLDDWQTESLQSIIPNLATMTLISHATGYYTNINSLASDLC